MKEIKTYIREHHPFEKEFVVETRPTGQSQGHSHHVVLTYCVETQICCIELYQIILSSRTLLLVNMITVTVSSPVALHCACRPGT